MESLPGLKESNFNDAGKHTLHDLKLVPWLNWEEWSIIADSLFSSSPLSVDSSLLRISTWRNRGCIPVAIDVTASIIEIQQKDPFFRDNVPKGAQLSEEILTMLYSMAITRFVNGVIEKNRKKNEISIADAADAIGIPRMLIDVRHEGSHRDLPSLKLARLASTKALDWLQSYYWKPQRDAIKRDQTTKFQQETRDKLHELANCLKEKENGTLCSFTKEKRPKKPVTKCLKNILRLYYSSSSEVVSVLLEMLLNALDSSHLADQPDCAATVNGSLRIDAVLDYWKPVLTKLSKKASDFLVTFLRGILEKIEILAATESQVGNATVSRQIQLLSLLLESSAVNVKSEDSSEDLVLQKENLHAVLCKCLTLSSHGNKHLMSSSVILASLLGNIPLLDKLKRLSLLSVFEESDPPTVQSEIFLLRQEESLRQAAKKLELIKLRSLKGKKVNGSPNRAGMGIRRWVVVDSWRPCPIGMLPHDFGSSGRLPILDCIQVLEPSSPNNNSGKRVADIAVECLDSSAHKKTREAESEDRYEADENQNKMCSSGIKGCLMIGGEWKKISSDELLALASSVRILV
ncbi:unnamed protein product [Cuscuta epithymum]|uniref:Ribosomal biogenesis protein LAS1L n=1 Tax=Cuscuta epithymum TaxID=186058 RepID=A0AAV0DZR8_9ASTE|nr:unnamed protein product [Cuscuta epithymum]CAH9129878.1 unnamed protein product [Cuscuta epithymum]